MYDPTARISRPNFRPGHRILVISDIHANLDYFKKLLDKAGFCQDDELVLDGDFLEKGPASLETLRYIMQLCEQGNVYPVIGNCDGWEAVYHWPNSNDVHTLRYIQSGRRGILREMTVAMGLDPEGIHDFSRFKWELRAAFPEEWDFLSRQPHIIETPHLIFVHSGIRGGKPLSEQRSWDVMKYDNFLRQGLTFDKWVIVGHWPVVLYGADTVSAKPIIDREHRIVSIDGGCVLKDDGQLNALVIPSEDSSDFSYIAYDHFPVRTVRDHQDASAGSYYIRWGDSTVKVLKRGPEFSLCRHVRTGYEMEILTKYLFSGDEITGCNDCTDYVLPLEPGDRVSVVETTSRGYFVKHDSVSGWYFGRLE